MSGRCGRLNCGHTRHAHYDYGRGAVNCALCSCQGWRGTWLAWLLSLLRVMLLAAGIYGALTLATGRIR